MVVMRAPLEMYPPSQNLVELLLEKELEVTVIDVAGIVPPVSIPGLRRVVGAYKRASKLSNIWQSLRFLLVCWYQRFVYKPVVTIAYDPQAMFFSGLTCDNSKLLIWHFHELIDPYQPIPGFFERHTYRYAARNLALPDIVVFPDAFRAVVYEKLTGQEAKCVRIVKNCPRSMLQSPEAPDSQALVELNVEATTSVVAFLGIVGRGRCIEQIVDSMRYWPDESVFLVVGSVTDSFRESLQKRAERVGVGKRLKILGTVHGPERFRYLKLADLGISLANTSLSLNWKYSAGALNKRFEYMAVGLPQVTNQGRGIDELFVEKGYAISVDHTNVAEIGVAVSDLLANEPKRDEMAKKSRQAHLELFNYERESEELIAEISDFAHRNSAKS